MEPKNQILKRMKVVLIGIYLLPVLIAGQVLRIYIFEGSELRAQGEKQASSEVVIPAMRGAILDQAGRTLAVNTTRYDVALDPTAKGYDAVSRTFFDKLSKLTRHSASYFRQKVQGRSSRQYVKLLRGISERQKEAIDSWEIPGLILDPRFGRRYNYGHTLAHVLGHVNADLSGLAGLESTYDDFLTGKSGRRAVKRDRRGYVKTVADGKVVAPKHGENLVLTIDLIRQTVLEEELARGVQESGAKWGTAIAMDPNTGAILAMASVPTYDPNRAATFSDAERRNHAITDRIEPGSTFKLVTAVAAVEQGIVSMEDSIETGDGWMMIHGRTLKDTHAYGTITFSKVLAKSSNIGTAKVAAEMEPGVFYQYARNLGFGQYTWVDLPGEVDGKLKKPSEWSGTTLTSMSRGYEVDATPLQVLAAYSALANGGLLVRPYVVAERRDMSGRVLWRARQDSIRRAFKRKTARKLLPAFEEVIQTGTATEAQIEGLRIAGKTGTAMKVVGGAYSRQKYRASFVGFFPAEEPVVAMFIMMDEPRSSIYGGAVAAPVFRRTAERWLGTFPKVAKQVAPEEVLPKHEDWPMPGVEGQPAAIASARLIAAGYRTSRPDEDEIFFPVARQRPEAGAETSPGARVRLTLAQDTTAANQAMPDLTGLSVRQASYWLRMRGVKVKIEGHGRVVRQSPQAGSSLGSRAVLQCR